MTAGDAVCMMRDAVCRMRDVVSDLQGHRTINRAAPASSLSPSTPPPPSVKVCACCVYCHDEVVHQCPMLSGDPARPPHGT